MRRDYQQFKHRGAEIVLITQGTPDQTQTFCRDQKVPFPCLSDPERQAYAQFGLVKGSVGQVMGAHVWTRGLQAILKGHFGGIPVGDVFQMPGVFIVDRQGAVKFSYYSKDASDNPPNEQLLANLPAEAKR